MAVDVSCAACGQALQVDDEHAGWRVRCPRCLAIFVARGVTSPVIPTPPPLPSSLEQPTPATSAATPHTVPIIAQPHAVYSPSPADSPVAPSRPRAGSATASLVLGILAVFCFQVVCGIPAIICGVVALRTIRDSHGALEGDHAAKAGIALGILALLIEVAGKTHGVFPFADLRLR